MALLCKANSSWRVFLIDWLCLAKPINRGGLAAKPIFFAVCIGFASQSQSFSIKIDWLCLAKPIIFEGMPVFNFAKPFPCGCVTKPILFDGLTLLRKSFPTWWIQWLCFANTILCGGLALHRKAFPSWWIGFALQCQSFVRISFASQSRIGFALQCPVGSGRCIEKREP